jgi:multidrug efflux pump subunit AcrB
MPLIRFSINNPLLTNLMLGIVVVLGVLSWQSMPQEMFPTIELDAVRIQVEFEGASPEEVERQITIPVEEEFDGMAEIDVMSSTSHEGMSSLIIELKSGTDVDQFMRDAQTALDQITDLPEEAEEPELLRLKARFPVISMTLYGDVARGYLYDLADDVKRRMLALPGVAAVGVAGDRDWEIWVEVDPYRLAARGVSLGQVITDGRGAGTGGDPRHRRAQKRFRWPADAGRTGHCAAAAGGGEDHRPFQRPALGQPHGHQDEGGLDDRRVRRGTCLCRAAGGRTAGQH